MDETMNNNTLNPVAVVTGASWEAYRQRPSKRVNAPYGSPKRDPSRAPKNSLFSATAEGTPFLARRWSSLAAGSGKG